MTKKTLKNLYQALVLIFILPAIVFWVIFAFSGYSLGDFLSVFGFFIDGYRSADVAAKETFTTGIKLFACVYVAFLMLIILIIKSGREDSDALNN